VVAQQAVEGKGKHHDVCLSAVSWFTTQRALVATNSQAYILWRCGEAAWNSFMVAQRFIGALFGPCMTKWYQFLNQIKFSSPTKALIYRLWLDQAILTPGGFARLFAFCALLLIRSFSGRCLFLWLNECFRRKARRSMGENPGCKLISTSLARRTHFPTGLHPNDRSQLGSVHSNATHQLLHCSSSSPVCNREHRQLVLECVFFQLFSLIVLIP